MTEDMVKKNILDIRTCEKERNRKKEREKERKREKEKRSERNKNERESERKRDRYNKSVFYTMDWVRTLTLCTNWNGIDQIFR